MKWLWFLCFISILGRLLRAFNIDFNWYKLSSWINVTEQWPYRLSWIILEVEDNPDIEDTVSMKTVYERFACRYNQYKTNIFVFTHILKSHWCISAVMDLASFYFHSNLGFCWGNEKWKLCCGCYHSCLTFTILYIKIMPSHVITRQNWRTLQKSWMSGIVRYLLDEWMVFMGVIVG